MRDWSDDCRDAAMALSKEKRQEFLDFMWKGYKLGDAYEKCGISFEAANGIMMMNIEEHTTLRRKSK